MTQDEMIESLTARGWRVLPPWTLREQMESAWLSFAATAERCKELLDQGGRLPRDEDRTPHKMEGHAERIAGIAQRMADSLEEEAVKKAAE